MTKHLNQRMSVFLIVALVVIVLIGGFVPTVSYAATHPKPPKPRHQSVTPKVKPRALQSSQVVFSPATDFPTNNRSYQIAKGDFNKDGKRDVVVTNPQQGAVSVFLGRGDGTFAPAVSYTTGGDPQGVAVGDVNGDGKLDIVTADHSSGNISVLLGNGDGTFAPAVTYPAHGQPWGIALGDFNGDHKLDIVTGNQGTGDISVLLNRGNGTFQAPFNTPDGHGTDARGVAVGDFNGDGKLDVVVADGNAPGADHISVSVLLGNNDGTFGSPNVISFGNTYQAATSVVVADLNHDGKLDIVESSSGCGYGGSDVVTILGNGDGSFQQPQSTGEGCVFNVAAIDINGDGILDLVTVNGDSPYDDNSYIHVHLGNGDGTFQSAISFSVSPGRAAYSLALLDLNGDGKPDVVTANYDTNDVSVLMNQTTYPLVGGPYTWQQSLGGGNLCFACLISSLLHGSVGWPVDTGTGNFWHTFSDIAIPGRGFPLAFSHTYNALTAGTDGPLGFGWTSSYNMSLSSNSTVATITQENGSQVTFTLSGSVYTAPPRVIATLVKNQDGTFTFTRSVRQLITFSPTGQLLKEADLNGYTTTFSYNGNNQLATVTDQAGRKLTLTWTGSHITAVADDTGRQVTFGYNDGNGDLTDVTDANKGTTHFTYDPATHLLLTMTDPRGNTLTNHYDSSNRVDYQIDPMQRKTTFAYTPTTTTTTDAMGNVTVEQYTYGLRTSLTKGYGTAQQATWSFSYDPKTLGITYIIDPNGHTTTKTYDTHGNVLTVTDGLQRETINTYNNLDELTSTTDPLKVITTLKYDSRGNLLSVSRPLIGTNQIQTTTYRFGDPSHPGDVTAMIDPDQKTWQYSYDTYGDRASVTDPLGDKTTATYNTIGWKLTSVTPKGNVTGGNPLQYTTTYQYNSFGEVTTVTDPLGHLLTNHYDADGNRDWSVDADNNKTIYSYDADNELTTVTRPDGSTQVTDYNSDGTMKDQIDGNGKMTSYGYDALARVVSVTDPLNRTTTSTYDGVGNLLTQTDPRQQTSTFTYDAANELGSITYSDGRTSNVSNIQYDADSQRTQMTDGTGTSSWSYDSLHRLTSGKDGAGNVVGYGYDLKGQLTSLTYPGGQQTVTRNYDHVGRLHSVTDWLGNMTTFSYDANSNMKTVVYPTTTQVTDTFTYDSLDRLIKIADAKAGTNFATFSYQRDANSQLTSQTATGVGQPKEVYSYDPLNQLTKVNNLSYGYDKADNITQLTNGAILSYDNANELTSLSYGGKTTTYGYDLRGDRILISKQGGSSTALSYDQANRLVSYGATGTYTYNGDGLRMTKNGAAFVWDVSQGLPLLLKDGSTSYVYGPGGLPLEQISGSTALYYHHDQLGSTRALTDGTGTLVATYTYDAYGKLTKHTGTVVNPFGYAGQYLDSESGMYYLRARYYDPATAQFLTRDPLVAVTHSAYAYVAGNPLNRNDAAGLWPDWVDSAANWAASKVSDAASAATTWVDNNAGTISAAAGTVATVTAFVPGLQGVAAVAGAVSLGTSAIQTGLDLRNGAGIGTIVLDAAALVPGVTAEAAALHGLGLARDLRAASDAAEFYSTFGSDVSRLLDIQTAEAMANNELRITNGWGSNFGIGSTIFGWGGVLNSKLCGG